MIRKSASASMRKKSLSTPESSSGVCSSLRRMSATLILVAVDSLSKRNGTTLASLKAASIRSTAGGPSLEATSVV